MNMTVPLKSHSSHLRSARLTVDTSGLGSAPLSRRALCRAYVDRIMRLAEVDYAALWVRDGLIHEPTHGGYDLAKASPDKGTHRRLSKANEVAIWAENAGAFGWMVSESPLRGIMDAPSFGPGVTLVFSQEQQIILALHIITEHAEIQGVQSSLAELVGFLGRRQADVERIFEEKPVVVDVGFLEAMAMGDEAFVRHMLTLCVEQIEETGEALSLAATAQDPGAVAHLAHKLRSTVRTVGAERLDDLLERVEVAADRGDIVQVNEAVLGCEQAVGAIHTLLAQR